MNYQLPYFGEINAHSLEAYYQSEIEFNGEEVSIYLSFENDTVDEQTIEKITSFLNNIIALEAQNRTLIKSDFDDDGETARYLQFFSKKLGMVSPDKLELMEISLFPDSEDPFAQFDYYIKLPELHSQLLTVRLTETGELVHIAWES